MRKDNLRHLSILAMLLHRYCQCLVVWIAFKTPAFTNCRPAEENTATTQAQHHKKNLTF